MTDLTKAVLAGKVTDTPESKKDDKHEDRKQKKPPVKRAKDIKVEAKKSKGSKVFSDSTEF